MAILTREAILGAQDLKRQTVKVPEWGGEIILTELTADRRLEFEKLLPKDGEEERIWQLLVTFCAVDEGGQPLFTLEDVQALGKKNGKVLTRLGRVALKMNKVGAAQERDLEENFTESQG